MSYLSRPCSTGVAHSCIGWSGSNGGGTSVAWYELRIDVGELCLKGISRGCDLIAVPDEAGLNPESNGPEFSCILILGRFVVASR